MTERAEFVAMFDRMAEEAAAAAIMRFREALICLGLSAGRIRIETDQIATVAAKEIAEGRRRFVQQITPKTRSARGSMNVHS